MNQDGGEAKGAPKIIECPVCARKMAIPPGYENRAGKCRRCGAALNTGGEFDVDPLNINIDTEPVARRRPPLATAQPESWKSVALAGLMWGLIGAAVVGTGSGSVNPIFVKQRSVGATLAIANSGALVGFIICSIFVVVRRLSAGPLKAVAIGAAISLVSGVLSYLFEWYVIAVSERTLLETAAMAVMGGSLVGIVFGTYLNRE